MKRYPKGNLTEEIPYSGFRNRAFTVLSSAKRLDFAADAVSISAATKAVPCQITAASHGLVTGNRAYIRDIVGMTELNNRTFGVKKIDDVKVTLIDETGKPLRSTGFGTYTSGGELIKLDSEALAECRKVTIQNLGTDIVYVGSKDVSTSNGIGIKPDGAYDELVDDLSRLWLISDGSGSTDIRVEIKK